MRALLLLLGLALAGCTPGLSGQPSLPGAAGEPSARADQLLRMGREAMASGDLYTAASLYQRAVQAAPGNREALLAVGDAMQLLERPQEASEAFAAVLRQAPADLDASRGYAKAMIALGRPEAAAAYIEPQVALHPADPSLMSLMGVVLDLQARHDEAAVFYRRGLEAAPNDTKLRNNYGLSLALAGQIDAALEILEPLTQGVTSTPRTRQNLALIYGLKGDLVAAERLSLLDLGPKEVASNLAYFTMLRNAEPSQSRSAALRPTTITVDQPEAHDQSVNLVLGLTLGGEDVTLGMPPTGSWLVDLGPFASNAEAERRWLELRRDQALLTRGVTRLATNDASLLIGPFLTAADAQHLCDGLDGEHSCKPARL